MKLYEYFSRRSEFDGIKCFHCLALSLTGNFYNYTGKMKLRYRNDLFVVLRGESLVLPQHGHENSTQMINDVPANGVGTSVGSYTRMLQLCVEVLLIECTTQPSHSSSEIGMEKIFHILLIL
jgi:hypothetical protein